MRVILLGLVAAIPVIAAAGPVDINTADAATIARELNGVGDSRAQAIVDYREKNGRFASPDDVLKVSGIGPQVLKLNRDNIRTGGQATKPAAKP
ncbi:MAG: helix-hairpin-helix domain-containing protein [Gammaproteobacteria bacterium]|nr:helix-hairpin-helix domain-containing protein [Gammaproteobacteria bacterium]